MAADEDRREPSTLGGGNGDGDVGGGDELDEREAALLEAWTPSTPPPGFADRVMAARERALAPTAVKTRRWPYVVGATAVIAAAGVALFVGVRGGRSRAASGDLAVGDERTTAQLGDRAVAVAEAGATVSWRIDGDGDADVVQRAGDVFYRVDRGGDFVVHTPAGDVRVTGTCFRIEVADMKSKQQMILSGAVGAALAAAVVITVYEGRVVAETKSAKTEVAAGNRATLGADGTTAVAMAREAVGATSEADATATRDQLLARTQTQRSEIAKLRTQVAELEKRGSGARPYGKHPEGPEAEGRPVYEPTPEQLQQWAKDCHVRVDQPGIERFTPMTPGGRNDRGLEPSEIEAYNAAMNEVAKQFKDLVRGLYIEATGDTAGADTLSADAMKREIEEKSSREEFRLLMQKISAERAGLQPPPADLGKTSPMERLYRAYLALGDQSEAALAKRLGAQRARAIRGNGWDSQARMSGCPSPGGGD